MEYRKYQIHKSWKSRVQEILALFLEGGREGSPIFGFHYIFIKTFFWKFSCEGPVLISSPTHPVCIYNLTPKCPKTTFNLFYRSNIYRASKWDSFFSPSSSSPSSVRATPLSTTEAGPAWLTWHPLATISVIFFSQINYGTRNKLSR